MTKITCLGDSIRMQYTPVVRELLGEDFEIFAPSENCRCSKYTLRGMFDWRNGMEGSRIVHFNCGLWDTCDLYGDGLFAPIEEYVSNMLRIADILISRHEVVIFATTTPVSPLNVYNKNNDIQRYNDTIVPLLRERGVLINDLYSLVAADVDRYVCDDKVHLTDEGIKLCAVTVADSIRTAKGLLSVAATENFAATFKEGEGAPVPFEE